jgi:hypothetical protein
MRCSEKTSGYAAQPVTAQFTVRITRQCEMRGGARVPLARSTNERSCASNRSGEAESVGLIGLVAERNENARRLAGRFAERLTN